jgi:hypothetical protein
VTHVDKRDLEISFDDSFARLHDMGDKSAVEEVVVSATGERGEEIDYILVCV